METENRLRKFRDIVDELCHSGQPELDEQQMKFVKNMCQKFDFYILDLYKILMKKLHINHAEVRLSAFQICEELFLRSHIFRGLLLTGYKNFIELTVGYNPLRPLPKPFPAAVKLRESAIKAIQNWREHFNEGYPKIKLGYFYLKDCINVDFDNMAVVTGEDRQRREDERRKQDEIMNRRIRKVLEEMNETTPDISNTITQFNNAFKLLIPDLDNFFIPVEKEEASDETFNEGCTTNTKELHYEFGSDVMREHGINKETTVQVNLSDIHKIHKTPDNELIIITIQEYISDITKNLLPKVREWEQSILKYSSSHSDLIKKIVDLKASLELVMKRYASIDIVLHPENKMQKKLMVNNSDSDDDDNDFIDVPFDDPRVVRAAESEAALLQLDKASLKKKIFNTVIDSGDLQAASSSGECCSKSSNIDSRENFRSKLKRKKVELDIDKLSSEPCQQSHVFNKSITGLNQIWGANEVLHDHDEDTVKPSGLLGIATRAVDYQREWEPVRWQCRFPLPTGRLCPRKDRERCPIHGPVVPRDNKGMPIRPEDIANDQLRQEKYEREHPAWQDPSLLADIRASTGIDLDMKKVKSRKRKYPNLTDLKSLENTPRKRLEKKIFSKNAQRKLNKA